MKSQKQRVDQAVAVLQKGGVIAYPTEAVYGLGCDPENIIAIKKLLRLKQRNKDKGLILVAADFNQLKPYLLPLEKNIEEKLLDSWRDSTKAITWLVPAKESVSEYLKGKFNTLAVRVSTHKQVKALCEVYHGAIVSTSANKSKQEPARTAEQVQQIFDDEVDFIVEGETNKNAQPSEIRDAVTDKIIRQ